MFNRFESLKKAIEDKSIEKNTLEVMIDFHAVKGTLSGKESAELLLLLNSDNVQSELVDVLPTV